MQQMDITTSAFKDLPNPRGLQVVHIKKTPVLTKIVDETGALAWPEFFSSKTKAENRLYWLLQKAVRQEKAKADSEVNKDTKKDKPKAK